MYFFPPDIFIVLQISLVGCLITKPHNGYFQSHTTERCSFSPEDGAGHPFEIAPAKAISLLN